MKKVFSQEPVLKSRMTLVVAVYIFSVLFSFFGAYFIYRQNLGYPHLVLLQLVAFLLPLLLYKLTETGRGTDFSLVRFRPIFMSKLILWFVSLSLIAFSIYVLTAKPLTLFGATFLARSGVGEWGKFLLSFVLVPSVAEEILIRGAWQQEAEKRNLLGAVIVSALMSASFGFLPISCLYLLISGFGAAMVRVQSDSVCASILLSLFWRGVFYLFFPLMPLGSLSLLPRVGLAIISFLIGILVLFFALDRKERKELRSKKASSSEEGSGVLLGLFGAVVVVLAGSLVLFRFLLF